MKKLFVALISILIVTLLISGWAALKLLADNNQLKKQVSGLKQEAKTLKQSQPSNAEVNFIPGASVKEVYDFAQENQGLLKKIDCYCGCQMIMHVPNHKNLANCFVKEITSDGQIIYDNHGQNCKTCVDEAMDVKKWLGDAKNYQSIKDLIDSKYKPPVTNHSQ